MNDAFIMNESLMNIYIIKEGMFPIHYRIQGTYRGSAFMKL